MLTWITLDQDLAKIYANGRDPERGENIRPGADLEETPCGVDTSIV